MRPRDVFDYFKQQGKNQSDIARLLGLSRAAVGAWRRMEVIPPLSAARLHIMTFGALHFDPANYSRWNQSDKRKRKAGDRSVKQ